MNLKETELLNELNETEIEDIGRYFQEQSHKKRDMIFSEGEPAQWLYILLSGKVKITKYSNDGKEIILELIQAGNIFGGLACYHNFSYPASAVAMSDGKTVRISRGNLIAALDKYPVLTARLSFILGSRMKESHEKLKDIALERVESRIASLIIKLAAKEISSSTSKNIHLDIKLTKQEIADMVGTSVETTIRTISRFKKEGIIEEKQGRIIIKDLQALKNYSQ
ncbi:Cyclic nucleotide-binding domain protein [Candidatus Magnetoovum chiemensis]|nr:Cyclic nucleotide-binding domain protein [Candidatus Magnetoovum chiemensis]